MEKDMRIRMRPTLATRLEEILTEYAITVIEKRGALPEEDRELWRFLGRLRQDHAGRASDPPPFPFWRTEEGQRRALKWLRRDPDWYLTGS